MNESPVAVLDRRPDNPFALAGRNSQPEAMIQVASSREAQSVQASMAIAKRFPRNTEEAFTRIMTACQRRGLAESALFSYPKGGQQITGPSIRLAEAMAQAWGNLDFGVVEMEQRDGESTVLAYCCDLETNTRQQKVFQVQHRIQLSEKRGGGFKDVTDPRDIYELVANTGARRLRACILGIIPGDVVEAAVEQCERTIKGANQSPLIDRVRLMASKFAEMSVSVAMLEKNLGHRLDATNEQEMVKLRKIFTSLKDGMSKREDWFEHSTGTVEKADLSPTPTSQGSEEPKAGSGFAFPESAPPRSTGAPFEPPPEPAGEAPTVPNETLGAKPKRRRAIDSDPGDEPKLI